MAIQFGNYFLMIIFFNFLCALGVFGSEFLSLGGAILDSMANSLRDIPMPYVPIALNFLLLFASQAHAPRQGQAPTQLCFLEIFEI